MHSTRLQSPTILLYRHPTMSSESSTSIHAFNRTEYGNIPLLTYLNYEAWKGIKFHVLRALDADNIIAGEEEEPMPIDLDYKDYKKRASKAASIISLSFSPEIRPYLKGLQTPREMWETLQTQLDSAVILIGRTGILRKFCTARPQKDGQINSYGSGGLKPTPVRASFAVVLFAQNKRSPPNYAVDTKPMSSAAVRALQMTDLLLYFWSQQKIPFWIAECKWGWGFAVKARRFR